MDSCNALPWLDASEKKISAGNIFEVHPKA